jgi:hypothetical protein
MIVNITITIVAVLVLYSLFLRETIKCANYERILEEDELFEDDNCYRDRYDNSED